MGAAKRGELSLLLQKQPMELAMKCNDLSRSLVAFDQNSTLVAVVELSVNSWVAAGVVPGLGRDPVKQQSADCAEVLKLVHWGGEEGMKGGGEIKRMVVALEAGRDGFWLAGWLRDQGIEVYVIHPTSVAVSREPRRAKSDRLDTQMLKRAVLGWLRGEPKHCSMVDVPTLAQEDAKRPNREHEHLVGERTRIVNRMKATMARHGIRGFKLNLRKARKQFAELRMPEGGPLPPNTLAELERDLARLQQVRDQINAMEKQRLKRLRQAPQEGRHPMILLLAKVLGVGIETADMLVNEALWRNLRDERAIGRYAGMTGSPDERGSKRREKGLARAGNAGVRRGCGRHARRRLLVAKEHGCVQVVHVHTPPLSPRRSSTD